MLTTYLRLRRDLLVSRQETAGGLVFVLKDPQLGRFVRLREHEYFIARQFDGETSPQEVRQRGEAHLGARLGESTLERFTSKLNSLGLLEDLAAARPAVLLNRRPARVRGNILALRFRAIDPDALLAALVPRLNFVFTTAFACFSMG